MIYKRNWMIIIFDIFYGCIGLTDREIEITKKGA